MLDYQEALAKVLGSVPRPKPQPTSIEKAFGCVLAEPAVADMSLPPFKKATMDGYAVRSDDAVEPTQLVVVGTIAAGSSQIPDLEPGQAIQIMTGAPVPAQADAVIMVEKTTRVSDREVALLSGVAAGQNVAAQGCEVSEGDTVLAEGSLLGAAQIAVLAAFGYRQVQTFQRPTISVVATGDEVVSISAKPRFGQIRNSNSYMLWAQCLECGINARRFPPVSDDPEKLREAFSRAMESDMVLFSGGVSMGEFDYIPDVLKGEGVSVAFHKASIKPGKPILLGRKDDKLVFGLPGNPVSSFVTFELFVKPAIRHWMGFEEPVPAWSKGTLAQEARHKVGRTFFRPCRVSSSERSFSVVPLETKGSADIVAFSRANALMVMPADTPLMHKGEPVDFFRLGVGEGVGDQ